MSPGQGQAKKLPRTLSIDLKTATATADAPSVGIAIAAPMPGIELGLPGPTGPPGLVKIVHGSDANVARPVAPLVYWVGTVQPLHALPDDLLMLKGT
jgi:hypothetical protein